MGSDRVRTGIAVAVTSVWGVLAVSTIVTENYTALGATTPVMMIVVSFLFGYKAEGKRMEKRDRERSDDLSDW